MSDQPKKRPLFQYHLSTAVVLMFVAAGLLWLNMRRDTVRERVRWGECGPQSYAYGWPFEAYCYATPPRLTTPEGDLFPGRVAPRSPPLQSVVVWHRVGLLGDILVALAIVIAVGVFCEWLIRRREPGTTNHKPGTAA
jgi:hypothetical protein